MKMELYYRKYKGDGTDFMMDQGMAGKLTLADLVADYELMARTVWPEGTIPDDVFAYYQDRAIPLPPSIGRTSMSAGDLVVLDHNVYICCRCGWYAVELSRMKAGDILAG